MGENTGELLEAARRDRDEVEEGKKSRTRRTLLLRRLCSVLLLHLLAACTVDPLSIGLKVIGSE